MRILFLSRWFPYPPNNGSKLRIFNLLRGLAQHHQVTLLTFADQPDVNPAAPELKAVCQTVRVVPWQGFNPHSWRARLGFLSKTPRSVIDTFSPAMAAEISNLLTAEPIEAVIASQIDMAVYSRYFRHLPALFEEVEVGVIYEAYAHADSRWSRVRNGLTWAKYQRYLSTLLQDFQACTVVSGRERQILAQIVAGYPAIEIVPNGVDLASYNIDDFEPEPKSLIFTGSLTYYPNYEAVNWFLEKVYPELQAKIPDLRLTVTGDHAGRSLLAARGVTLTGFVDDVRPLVGQSWASVVPLHTGGGTRLKILEAMALRTPVISTSKGAEGLDVQPDVHLLIADTPKSFIRQVIRLMQEPELRPRLVGNAYRLVRDKYDWPVVLPPFLNLLERIAYN